MSATAAIDGHSNAIQSATAPIPLIPRKLSGTGRIRNWHLFRRFRTLSRLKPVAEVPADQLAELVDFSLEVGLDGTLNAQRDGRFVLGSPVPAEQPLAQRLGAGSWCSLAGLLACLCIETSLDSQRSEIRQQDPRWPLQQLLTNEILVRLEEPLQKRRDTSVSQIAAR